MLATMSPSIFHFDSSADYRPAVSSPLSSSPLQASQSSPLSPRDPNTLPRRDFFSSPIQQPKFKFAQRNAKPNPLRQSRENARENRRKLFLKGVRDRADDKKWEQRGGDQEVLKLEWSAEARRRKDIKEKDLDGLLFEEDIDDLAQLRQEDAYPVPNDEDMMVDSMAQEEQDELDAMFAMYQSQPPSQPPSQQPQRPESPMLSDDEDYDSLFRDLMSQEGGSQGQELPGDIDMS